MPDTPDEPEWTGDDPTKWPESARRKIARWHARIRKLRIGRRAQRDHALEALGRVSLLRAIEMAAVAGKPQPWRWVRTKICEGELSAWGTIGNRPDQRLDPAWLDHTAIFTDERGQSKTPGDDDCLWFEPGGDRPRRISEIAVDATQLAQLLSGSNAGKADKRKPKRAKRIDEKRYKIAEAMPTLVVAPDWQGLGILQRCRCIEQHFNEKAGWCPERTYYRAMEEYEKARLTIGRSATSAT